MIIDVKIIMKLVRIAFISARIILYPFLEIKLLFILNYCIQLVLEIKLEQLQHRPMH